MRRLQLTALLGSFLLLNVLSTTSATAGDHSHLVGRQVVVITDNAELKVGSEVIGHANICAVLQVTRVEGEWLWIESKQAYVRRQDVVHFDDAIAHFTDGIRRVPSAANYLRRSLMWYLDGELEPAIADVTEAIEIAPGQAVLHQYRGVYYTANQQYDAAIADHSAAIRLEPENHMHWYNRAINHHYAGNVQEALDDYNRAIQLVDIDDVSVSAKEGQLSYTSAMADYYCDRASAHRDLGNYDLAIADCGEAIRFNPQLSVAYSLRGECHSDMGEYDRAVIDFTAAIQINPELSDAYYRRGYCHKCLQDFDLAMTDWLETVRLDANHADAHCWLGWLFSTCPDSQFRDGGRAIECATTACELNGFKDAGFVATLAAAYAESGDFDRAIETQRLALSLTTEQDREMSEARLALYESGQPYRDVRESSSVVSKNR